MYYADKIAIGGPSRCAQVTISKHALLIDGDRAKSSSSNVFSGVEGD